MKEELEIKSQRNGKIVDYFIYVFYVVFLFIILKENFGFSNKGKYFYKSKMNRLQSERNLPIIFDFAIILNRT